MASHGIGDLFEPASIALIGASERPGLLGEVLARNLLAGACKGELFFINRRHQRVQDRPAYRTIADLPVVPELAMIATPPRTVPELLRQLDRAGSKIAVVATPAIAHQGDRDAAFFPRDAPRLPRLRRLRVLGPASGGLIVPRWGLNGSLAEVLPGPGRLALVSQSGAVLVPLMAWARAQGIGFSQVMVVGGGGDIDVPELLDWLADDPDTQAILLDLETVQKGRSFLSAARAVARSKPVIVLRAGQHRNDPLWPTDAIYQAAFRRVGLQWAASLRELFWAAKLLACDLPVVGDRLAIIANSRGLGLLAVDALLTVGGRLAHLSQDAAGQLRQSLPADVTLGYPLAFDIAVDIERFATILQIVLRERDHNGTLVVYAPNSLANAEKVATTLIDSVERCRVESGERPCVLVCWLGEDSDGTSRQRLHERGIPTFDLPEDAIGAFMHRWHQVQSRIGLMATPPPTPAFFAPDPTAPRRLVADWLARGCSEPEAATSKALLALYGIAITLPEMAEPAPFALSLRLLVDPVFGAVLLLEPASRATDAMFAESVVVFPPLNGVLAREAIRHTRVYRFLRDTHSDWLASLVNVLESVARLVVELGEVSELELKPIQLHSSGAAVTVARLRIAPITGPAEQRLAIRPYPRELEETISLPDGSTLLIRPVRPQDEPNFVASFAQLSTEEVRMRFMYTFKELIHEEAARLTQIDYGRDMALVVFRQRPGQPLESCGVARLMRADEERVEFAIILLRAATGIGLGSLLVRRLIGYARTRDFRELFGEILRENAPMLALCRAMGFTLKPCADDPGVIIATLALTVP